MLVPTGAEGKYEYDPSIPAGSGGGGGDITVEALSITENDTYTAPAGKAYSPVVVNVSGGGSSTYTITLISAPDPHHPDSPASVYYTVNAWDMDYTYLGGAIKDGANWVGEYQTEVWKATPQDIEVMIFPSKGISVNDGSSGQPISVTGDAEIIHHEDEGYWDVYVTGNCTITYEGSR